MKINKAQALTVWYGSVILAALAIILGSQSEQPLFLVFSFLQFILALFLILGSEEGRTSIKSWKHIFGAILIFIISCFLFLILLQGFGSRRTSFF